MVEPYRASFQRQRAPPDVGELGRDEAYMDESWMDEYGGMRHCLRAQPPQLTATGGFAGSHVLDES